MDRVRFADGDAWLLDLIPRTGCDLEALLRSYVFVARDGIPPFDRVRECLRRGVLAGIILPPTRGRFAVAPEWDERFEHIVRAHSPSEVGIMELDEVLAAADCPAVGPEFVLNEEEYLRAAERVDRHYAEMLERYRQR